MAKRPAIESSHQDTLVSLMRGDTLEDVRYGRWHDDKDGHYLLPGYLSGSDYSGTLVEKSNYNKWHELFSDGQNEWWTDTPGGHGTFGILIDLDVVPDDVSEEVADFINGLHDYALADEDLHSNMEMEAQNEAWDNWAKSDFKSALEKKFDVDLDDVDGEKLFELFREAMDASNTYWENEQGDQMYVDLDRVIKKISKDDVLAMEGAKATE